MKILIIDENPLDRKLAVTILESGNHEVFAAPSLKEGIRLAGDENPDVIVLGVFEQDLAGGGGIYSLRENPATRKTPLVAMTALAMKGDRERILSSGYDYYIAKPIRYQALLKLIRNIGASDMGES